MYDHEYVEFDEYGLSKVLCMRCGVPIVVRTYVEVQSLKDLSKKENVMTLRRMGNHSEIKVTMSDGSVTQLPHCVPCAKETPDTEKANVQRIAALRKEMVVAGKPSVYIEEVMKKNERVTMSKENVNAR